MTKLEQLTQIRLGSIIIISKCLPTLLIRAVLPVAYQLGVRREGESIYIVAHGRPVATDTAILQSRQKRLRYYELETGNSI